MQTGLGVEGGSNTGKPLRKCGWWGCKPESCTVREQVLIPGNQDCFYSSFFPSMAILFVFVVVVNRYFYRDHRYDILVTCALYNLYCSFNDMLHISQNWVCMLYSSGGNSQGNANFDFYQKSRICFCSP